MAKYRVQGPDGKVYVIEGPEGASAEEIESVAADLIGPSERQEPKIGTKAPRRAGGSGGGLSRESVRAAIGAPAAEAGPKPTDGMSTGQLAAAGLGSAISNAGLGLRGLVQDTRAEVEEKRRLDAALLDTGAGFAGNLAGEAAMTLAPGGMLKGAGLAARAGGAPGASRTLSAAGDVALTPRGIPAGAAVGAATGAIQPAASGTERLNNAVVGSMAGAALPAARTGFVALQPFYEAGQERIVGRALNRSAGADADAVIRRLEEGTAPFTGPQQGVPRRTMGELVPGAEPTVSQLARNPGMTAMEQAATATSPEAKNALSARLAQQQDARVRTLEEVAGDEGQRAFYDAERKATAQQLYQQAFEAGIDPQALTPEVRSTFERLAKNPYVKDALPAARKLAEADGLELTGGSLQGMHYVKLALDEAIQRGQNPQNALGANTLRQLNEARNGLVDAMEGISPDYAAARQTFRDMSAPIDRMDVGQALVDRAVDKLSGNIKPRQLANAFTDDTAARVTRRKGATLESTLGGENVNKLRLLVDDLARADETVRAGRGIGSNTLQNLAYASMLEQAGVPAGIQRLGMSQTMGNILGRGADVLYGRANQQVQNKLAQILIDPEYTLSVMRRTSPANRNALLDAIQLGGQTTAVTLPRVASPLLVEAEQ